MVNKDIFVEELFEGRAHCFAHFGVVKLDLGYSNKDFDKLKTLEEVFRVVCHMFRIDVGEYKKTV